MKKIISIILSFVLISTAVFGIMPQEAVEAAVSYNANAALDYARAHWNDGQGLCAEFVSKCVRAGGINMPVIATTYECYKKVSELSGIPGQDLALNASGYATYGANSSKLAAGDVVVQWCYTCNLRPHILLCGGYNASGNATFYAHNSALNNGVYQLNKNSQHKSTCNIGAKVIHLEVLTDTAPPVISDVHVEDVNSEGYTVVCRVEDAGGVSKVQFPTWTVVNDQDDIAANWEENPVCSGTQNGTLWSYRVKISDHNNERGFYRTHIYAWDRAGNRSSIVVPDVYVEEPKPKPPVENFSVGEVHIDAEEGAIHYYCDVEAGSGVSTANVTITTDTGISRNYTHRISGGKVDGYLYWLDFVKGMDAVYTITVSLADRSGNTASNSSSIDARFDVSLSRDSITLDVGETFQFDVLKNGVFRIDKDGWKVVWKEQDEGELGVSDYGLVTAVLPGTYRIEYQVAYSQNNVMTDDWDGSIPFCNPGRSGIVWIPAEVKVNLPAPSIQSLTAEKSGTIHLSIQESAGADSYEIIMKQRVNGMDGDTVFRKVNRGETEQEFRGLTDNGEWNCKIRACCTVGTQTYYSSWSAESIVETGDRTKDDTPSNGTQYSGSSTGIEHKAQNRTPKKTSICGTPKARSKGFTVKWKKQKSVTGYQVEYSTNNKFKNKTAHRKTVRKALVTKLTVKRLRAKKKYYVRVRTYRIVQGKTYYSGWSRVKTVRTKY